MLQSLVSAAERHRRSPPGPAAARESAHASDLPVVRFPTFPTLVSERRRLWTSLPEPALLRHRAGWMRRQLPLLSRRPSAASAGRWVCKQPPRPLRKRRTGLTLCSLAGRCYPETMKIGIRKCEATPHSRTAARGHRVSYHQPFSVL